MLDLKHEDVELYAKMRVKDSPFPCRGGKLPSEEVEMSEDSHSYASPKSESD